MARGSGKEQGAPVGGLRQDQHVLEQLTSNAVDVLPEGQLAAQLDQQRPLRIKLGIDPTAPDIHLGHAVVLGKLRQFQDAGHQVVLIIGDFTSRVGDPSGRSSARPMLTPEQIDNNARTFTDQAFKILDPDKTEIRFNSEWLQMDTQEMFNLLSQATVAQLLERNDFQERMQANKPLSLLELVYPLLQGYDSVAVEADVEIGGTDQKFNLLLGRDMQAAFASAPDKQMASGQEFFQSIMTMPVLPGTDGVDKMSKSKGNYIAITDDPDEMFGKTMSIPDQVMPDYYRLLLNQEQPDIAPALAKRQLGRELVSRFHSAEAATEAEAAFDRVHVKHQPPEELEQVVVSRGESIHLPALIAEQFGISRGEARRRIKGGAVKLDGVKVAADTLNLDADQLDGVVLQAGKRQYVQLQAQG